MNCYKLFEGRLTLAKGPDISVSERSVVGPAGLAHSQTVAGVSITVTEGDPSDSAGSAEADLEVSSDS